MCGRIPGKATSWPCGAAQRAVGPPSEGHWLRYTCVIKQGGSMSWPWPFLCPRFCKFTKSKQIWVEVLFDSDSQRCTGSWAAFLSASPPCWLSPVALPTSFKPGYLSCPRAASAGRAPAPPARHVIPVESCVCGELIFSSTLFGIRTQPTVTLWGQSLGPQFY